MLKVALFDLGGTLWEHLPGLAGEDILERAAPEALRLLPPGQAVAPTPSALARAVRAAYVAAEDRAAAGDRAPFPPEAAVSRGLAALGVTVDDETARAMLATLYVPESRTTRLLPGAVEVLTRLAGAGLRLGIVSNRLFGGTRLLDDLGYFGISHLFGSMIASCDIGYLKPHPLLFRRALEELDADPAEAVMVGDSLEADIAGAAALGLRAVWVRRPPDRPDPAPAGVPAIVSLSELPPLLGLD